MANSQAIANFFSKMHLTLTVRAGLTFAEKGFKQEGSTYAS